MSSSQVQVTNAGLQLAERVGRYCAGVRSSKGTFDLEAFGQIVQECTAGLGGKPPLSLGSIALYTNTLSTDLKASTTAITDPEHVAQGAQFSPSMERVSRSKRRHLQSLSYRLGHREQAAFSKMPPSTRRPNERCTSSTRISRSSFESSERR